MDKLDKLDKLPPQDLKGLKDRPIASGLISNTIFQIVWNGIYFMIAWLVNHYALIFGIPPFLAILLGVVAFFLMSLSVNLLRRRKEAVATLEFVSPAQFQPQPDKPTIEILSPFDNDYVGLYETVRGHVFPPDQELQVVVFAGDKKWYPQKPVSVKGSTWSVKCQFGNLQNPSGGSYKVVALLGNELKGGMWYSNLPADVPRSNIISVHRLEVTTEQKLAAVISERDQYKNQLQTATNDLTDKDAQIAQLNTALNNERIVQQSLRQGFENRSKEVIELKDKLAIETARIEEYRSEIVQLKGYVRHTEQYRGLRETADTQRRNIGSHVKLEKITLGDLALVPEPGHPRSVRFGLYVTNHSMWEISLKNELDGVIRFEGTELEERKKVINSVIDLPVGGTACVTIEQRLSLSDVQVISEARHAIRMSHFHFKDLVVTIKGGQRALEIEERPLDMNFEKVPAFPVSLEEQGQRIRAFAEIRGSCVQLHEPLRIGNEPLAKERVENWQNRSLENLKSVFNDGAAENLWRKITHGVPFPIANPPSQRDWLQGCIVELGGLLAEETGEYKSTAVGHCS